MRGQRIHAILFGLVLLLGPWPSSIAWAEDAELFAGLIPGTPLTDEELDQYYGRGLHLTSRRTFLTEERTSVVESVRERMRELRAEGRGEVSLESGRGFLAVERETLRFDSRRANPAQTRTDARIDAIQAQIAEIRARLR